MKQVVMASTNPNKVDTARRLLAGAAEVLSLNNINGEKISDPGLALREALASWTYYSIA